MNWFFGFHGICIRNRQPVFTGIVRLSRTIGDNRLVCF
jgi:hypothetical protein